MPDITVAKCGCNFKGSTLVFPCLQHNAVKPKADICRCVIFCDPFGREQGVPCEQCGKIIDEEEQYKHLKPKKEFSI